MGVEAVAFDQQGVPAGVQNEVLTVVGWLWKQNKGPTDYTPERANIWARMIHRNLTLPHRFVLLTDQPNADYCSLIEPVPLWNDWRDLESPLGISKPSCYLRLKAFSPEAADIIGKRFVSIDLDCVVLKNLDSLFDRPEDFLIYRRPISMIPQDEVNTYQGSMWMMTAGARGKVWEEFKGRASQRAARDYLGTDQAWMRHILGPNESGWEQSDGVYAWPVMRDRKEYKHQPPEGARIIFFYGNQKPWHFASMDRPVCDNCGHQVQIKPPWEITLNRRGATDEYQWIPRNYR